MPVPRRFSRPALFPKASTASSSLECCPFARLRAGSLSARITSESLNRFTPSGAEKSSDSPPTGPSSSPDTCTRLASHRYIDVCLLGCLELGGHDLAERWVRVHAAINGRWLHPRG
eukprot:1891260-Pleurochrysis_carterae.AAC.5